MKERKKQWHVSSKRAIATPFVLAILLFASLILFAGEEKDSDAVTYGSSLDPYGGMNVHWNDLSGGAYYIMDDGCLVIISFDGLSMEGLSLSTEESGLEVSTSDGCITGWLQSSVTITLGSKVVSLSTSRMIVYGSLPVYYAESNNGTVEAPLTSLNTTAGNFAGQYFIKPNSSVSVTKSSSGTIISVVKYVDPGFGLSINDGSLTGTITKTGTIHVTANITIGSTTSYDLDVTIIVTEGGTAVSSISISGATSVDMGQMIELSAVVSPSNAAIKEVTWKIANDNGVAIGYIGDENSTFVLVGVESGTITVTATANDGVGASGSKTITVVQKEISIQYLKIEDYTNVGNIPVVIDPEVDLVYLDGFYNKGVNNLTMSGPKQFVNINAPATAPRFVFKPIAGTYELTWIHYTNATVSTDTGTFVLQVAMTITFNANGGTSVDGQTTWTQTTASSMSLPSAMHPTLPLLGWYDDPTSGTCVGAAGTTYSPTKSITLYAHWGIPTLVISSEFEWSGVQGGILEYTPSVKDSVTGNAVTGFKVTVTSDMTDCIYADGSTIYGQMVDLIPGNYTATILVSKTGYESNSQTITITMPVSTLEPITDNVVVGVKWTKTFTLKPDDAYIERYTVKLDGSVASASSYSASIGDDQFSIICKQEGVYTVNLVLSATGIASSTKTITLNSKQPEEHVDPPTITKITATKYTATSSPNTYYFSAVGATNYDTITWDFGDGSTDSGLEVIHMFKAGLYKVKCTVKNVTTGEEAYATYDLETLEQGSVDISDVINIGSPYEVFFITEYPSLTLQCTVSDGATVTAFTSASTQVSSGYMFKVTGTCNDLSLVGKTITFTVYNGSSVIKSWTATVYAAAGSGDTSIEVGCTFSTDGLTVTLKNISPNKASMSLLVDWGDNSVLNKGSADGQFSHTYSQEGTYQIQMIWKWTDSSGKAYQREYGGSVVVGQASTTHYSITYDANGGSGTMAKQINLSKYTILDCEFSYKGKQFVKWCTDKDPMAGTIYSPGDIITPSQDIVLYALWTDDPESDANDNTLRYAALAMICCVALILILRRGA